MLFEFLVLDFVCRVLENRLFWRASLAVIFFPGDQVSSFYLYIFLFGCCESGRKKMRWKSICSVICRLLLLFSFVSQNIKIKKIEVQSQLFIVYVKKRRVNDVKLVFLEYWEPCLIYFFFSFSLSSFTVVE